MTQPAITPTDSLPSRPTVQPPVHPSLRFVNAPNLLTLFRIFSVPLIAAFLFLRTPFWDVVAGICFAVSSITDYLDGYLARTQKQETIYGKLLDPLADKFLVITSLIALQSLGRVHPIIVILLVCREMAITSLRALASAEGIIIAASTTAKWKTAIQMVALPIMMADNALWGIPLLLPGQILLSVSVAVSIFSLVSYLYRFFREIHNRTRIIS
jgi:CDP-diacylglycerol--glycerol-3-phosphate 3-phosphatidyltransferase